MWSQENLTDLSPDNLGDVTIEDSGDPDDYAVKIVNLNVLGGGEINLQIEGNADDDITVESIPAGSTLKIDGTVSGELTINGDIGYDADTQAKGKLVLGTVTQLMTVMGDVNGDVTIDLVDDVDKVEGTDVSFQGDTGQDSVITLKGFANDPFIAWGSGEYLGKTVLTNGVPNDDEQAFGAVVCWISSAMDGTVDVKGKDVAGLLGSNGGGSGDYINGGDVTEDGTVMLAGGTDDPFTGTATFKDVNGFLHTKIDDMDGTVIVDSISSEGVIHIGATAVAANLGGTIHVTDDNGGSGNVAEGTGTGVRGIRVNGVLEQTGEILVDGEVLDEIVVEGTTDGNITLTDKLKGGLLSLVGNVSDTAYIRVNNMTTDGTTDHSLVDLQGSFDGDLLLNSGIPADQTVQIGGALQSDGEIDLNASDVAGTLTFDGGSGNVLDGGAVTATGVVSLGDGDAYSGMATFSSVASGGQIKTTGTANLSGTLKINNSMAGTIGIGGVGGSPAAANVSSGGKIWVVSDVSGTVSIGGDLAGDVDVDGDVTASGVIAIKHELKGTGSILIADECIGDIEIGDETEQYSLISMRHFSGTVTVNNGQGDFDADGDIYVGPTSQGLPPLPTTTFDGSILVRKESGTSDGGDLVRGEFDIYGCHATAADLDICLEGGDGYENVIITQTDCTNQVEASECP